MTTREFIKELEDMGFKVKVNSNEIWIFIEDIEIAVVDLYKRHKINTRLGVSVGNRLFDLLVEYSKTPIEDRAEEKKYYISPKGMKLGSYTLCHWIDGVWGEEFKYEISYEYQTQFTLKELEDLGIDVEHYDLEEV